MKCHLEGREEMTRSAAREGALNKLSPALCAGFGYAPTIRRPRRRPLQGLARREHFVVAASAATNFVHARYPAQSAGLSLLSAPSRAKGSRSSFANLGFFGGPG